MIEITYPNYFEEDNGKDPNEAVHIGIYSYVLGPHRMHDFNSFDKALIAVQRWHHTEMNMTY